ncbi:hypothetical protein BT69DRAFT_1275736 [Atractiella rhizophila]|nr:hypothetical protein BT69DRAFT_1275736 [Atractiella rhizophila]
MKNGTLSDAPPFITSTDGTPTPETSATLVGTGTDITPPFDLELEEEETLVFDGRAFVKQN